MSRASNPSSVGPESILARWSVLDQGRVDDLIDLDPEGELFQNIYHIFLEEVSKALGEMHGHLKDGNFKEISRLAHRLLSTGHNSGAPRVGELFRLLEALALEEMQVQENNHQANKDRFVELLDILKAEFMLAAAELKKFLH